MQKSLVALFILIAGRVSSGSPLVEYFADAAAVNNPARMVTATLDRPANPMGPGAVTVYDNYTAPGEGGQTVARGIYASADHIIQDDVASPVQRSQMSAYYILFSNRSTTSRLSRFSYAIEFVSLTGQTIGVSAFTVDFSIFPLPTQSTGVLGWPDGSLLSQNIVLPSEFFVRQRLFDPIGISSEELGVPFGGPQTVGLSSSGLFDATLGQVVDLGTSNSLMFRLRGNIVPSPSSASLLAASSLLAIRRRR